MSPFFRVTVRAIPTVGGGVLQRKQVQRLGLVSSSATEARPLEIRDDVPVPVPIPNSVPVQKTTVNGPQNGQKQLELTDPVEILTKNPALRTVDGGDPRRLVASR